MTLDEFVGPRETNEDAQTPVYMDCMDEISPDRYNMTLKYFQCIGIFI